MTAIILISFISPIFALNSNLLDKIKQQEHSFNTLSENYFLQNSKNSDSSSLTTSNIEDLSNKVSQLVREDNPVEAIQQIYNHKKIVMDNLDNKAVLLVTELLLKYGEVNLAKTLYEAIKNEADDFQFASIQFIFAKFHAQKQEWIEVNKLLENVPEELSAENSAYALLLKGTALQHLKQHRKAQQTYSKIPEFSKYYNHSLLNSAIADIRQDWLTNAQNTISVLNAAKGGDKEITHDFKNRLYLVLGYAFLQKDYFRNAREAFREVSQNSSYVNRALLGIALSAINQQDYSSALLTLSLLKDKKTVDLTTDESYLLIPYVYEKLNQELNVTSSSTEALNYYQQRISNLQDITQQTVGFNQLKFDRHTAVLTIQNENLELGDHFPGSFLTHYQQLLSFADLNQSFELNKQIKSMIVDFDDTFQLIITDLVNQQISYLESYINQVRYGLAKLYDNSNQQEQ